MAKDYVIKKKDTLKKVAKVFYGDPGLYKKLAEYNGIMNTDLIIVGQTIEIPAKGMLNGATPIASAVAGLSTPDGLAQVINTFGNIYDYISEDGTLDPHWETEQLSHARLPFSVPFSWDRSKSVANIYCHRKIAPILTELFTTIEKEGLRKEVRTFGGCFNLRSKRTGGKLSTHSWGIAVDLNPETNPQGKQGDINQDLVEIFRRYGFKWGGDWTGKSKDPMHFQFCTGY